MVKVNEDITKMQLDTALEEHKYLTDHLLVNFRLLIQIYTIGFGATTALSSFIFAQKAFDYLLVMPVFTAAILLYLLWLETTNANIHVYIKDEIEGRKIPQIIGLLGNEQGYKQYWLATEHWFSEKARPGQVFYRFKSYIPAWFRFAIYMV